MEMTGLKELLTLPVEERRQILLLALTVGMKFDLEALGLTAVVCKKGDHAIGAIVGTPEMVEDTIVEDELIMVSLDELTEDDD